MVQGKRLAEQEFYGMNLLGISGVSEWFSLPVDQTFVALPAMIGHHDSNGFEYQHLLADLDTNSDGKILQAIVAKV